MSEEPSPRGLSMPRVFGWAPGVRAFSSKRRCYRGNPPAGGCLPALQPKASGRRAAGGDKGRPYIHLATPPRRDRPCSKRCDWG